MNDANKETNAAYEEPKKKVYVKLIIFLALITALFIVLGAKFVTFYYKTHGIGGCGGRPPTARGSHRQGYLKCGDNAHIQ